MATVLMLIVLATILAAGDSMPARQHREHPLNNLDRDVRASFLTVFNTMAEKAHQLQACDDSQRGAAIAGSKWRLCIHPVMKVRSTQYVDKRAVLQAMLRREYTEYLWYIFVFPDISYDLEDRLSTPGFEHGLSRGYGLRHTSYVTKQAVNAHDGRAYIAAIMFQLSSLPWQYEDGTILETYASYMREWLHSCAHDLWTASVPLDLSEVAFCMIGKSRRESQNPPIGSLRVVLVLRSAPFVLLADAGLLAPGYYVALRELDSPLRDMIEAYAIPPLSASS